MPEKLSVDELTQQANFVFKGTVLKLKKATMDVVPTTDRTATVRVDEIIEAPEALADFAGREITVEVGGPKKVKEGEQVIFYASGWIFAEGLAVRSSFHRPAPAGVAALGVSLGDPAANLADKFSRVRYEQADVVVSGRVISVRLPPDEVVAEVSTSAAAAETPLTNPISEHDPVIQEAVVAVDEVHKGEHAPREAKVRFPSSTDVKWYKAPKFRPGQQGFFMLQKGETRETGRAERAMVAAMVTADEAEDAFTALHPADFQPLDRPGGVRLMIAAAADRPAEPVEE